MMEKTKCSSYKEAVHEEKRAFVQTLWYGSKYFLYLVARYELAKKKKDQLTAGGGHQYSKSFWFLILTVSWWISLFVFPWFSSSHDTHLCFCVPDAPVQPHLTGPLQQCLINLLVTIPLSWLHVEFCLIYLNVTGCGYSMLKHTD